ncbi:substrate-binding domain-containing protein [Bradyrhizobium sp. WD16]|uniref:substrate-binding domain-containing protein n=1 Tax=Bradyrhizobium sp. WD16 TaxID=1521768 RepID=UPI0020A36BD4|nr:substrate-binding domain-containing protein [Bradyrhizobium sp. WD16]
MSEHVVVVGLEEFTSASSRDYVVCLQKYAQRIFRCATATGQVEATKAGVGIGVLHDFSAADQDSLVRVLPQIEFRQSYFLVSHPDTADVRRSAVCRDFLVARFIQIEG